MGIKHAKHLTYSDGADPLAAQPTDWNADHTGFPQENIWVPGSNGYGLDDEFNDGVLDGAWVKVNTSRVTWTEKLDVLSVLDTGSDAADELHAILKPITGLSLPVTFETCFRYFTPYAYNYWMLGIMLADGTTNGAGKQMVSQSYTANDRAVSGHMRLEGYINFQTEQSPSGDQSWQWVGGYSYQRLIWASANTFHMEVSPDGVSWLRIVSNYNYTISPTYGGFYCSTWTGASGCIGTYEYFRVF